MRIADTEHSSTASMLHGLASESILQDISQPKTRTRPTEGDITSSEPPQDQSAEALANLRMRTARDLFQTAEPALITLIAVHSAALLGFGLVSFKPVHAFAFVLEVTALVWALIEQVRHSYYPMQRSAQIFRAVLLIMSSTIFVIDAPVNGWAWTWMLGTVAIYSIAQREWPCAAFVIIVTLYNEFLTTLIGHSSNPAEIFARVSLFSMTGYIGYWFGRTLNASARAARARKFGEARTSLFERYSSAVQIVIDHNLRPMRVSPVALPVLGYHPRELRRVWSRELVHPDDRHKIYQTIRQFLLRPQTVITVTLRVRHRNGNWLWLETAITNLFDQPSVRGIYLSIADVTARVRAEEQARDETMLLRTILNVLPEAIFSKDGEGRFNMSNRAHLTRLGFDSEAQLLGRRIGDVYPRDIAEQFARDDQEVYETGRGIHGREYNLLSPTGKLEWFAASNLPLFSAQRKPNGLVGILVDITDRKELRELLDYQGSHDALTGLHNRTSAVEKLRDAMSVARSSKSTLALLYCDLDYFKVVNDRYGHEAGDRCLRTIADRLRPFGMRRGYVVARFGADEFILFAHLENQQQAWQLAEEVLHAIHMPIHVDLVKLQAQGCIGIAMLREEHALPEDLIRDADAAMDQAKERGRNRIAFFDDRLRKRAIRHLELTEALRSAQERNELSLVYQPKVSLKTGMIGGFEVLMRWTSRDFGLISPVEFIPLAEESGLIVPLGLWALECACEQLRQWQVRYPHLDHLVLAVNVSMRQLLHEPFVRDVFEIIERSEIYPAALELEITESAAMDNPEQTVQVLEQLKKFGLRLALDDFGTGYSSLSYLRRLPVDVLKIDRAFVQGIESANDDAAIVKLVIALAQTMGIDSVAEGIESRANAEELGRLGCDIGQGYYFSRPLPTHEADELLAMNTHYIIS